MMYLVVFLGSGLGGMSRYGLFQIISAINATSWQATILCNLIGSFLISLIFSYLTSLTSDYKSLHHFLIIGYLGGFTTFSTFAFDSIKLYQNNLVLFGIYLSISVIGSLFLCLLGFYVGRLIGR